VSEVKWERIPYNVTIEKDGVKKIQRRIPPPKLHPMEAGDTVTIRRKKGDDWDSGDTVRVKGISKRQPNTIQVESNGKTTFLPYFDLEFQGRQSDSVVDEDERALSRDPLGSRYLLWP
jgi:hypothetical protein